MWSMCTSNAPISWRLKRTNRPPPWLLFEKRKLSHMSITKAFHFSPMFPILCTVMIPSLHYLCEETDLHWEHLYNGGFPLPNQSVIDHMCSSVEHRHRQAVSYKFISLHWKTEPRITSSCQISWLYIQLAYGANGRRTELQSLSIPVQLLSKKCNEKRHK